MLPFHHLSFPSSSLPPFPSLTSTASTALRTTFDNAFAEDSTANGVVKRHARENYDKALEAAQEMELKLSIVKTWTSDTEEWKDAANLVVSRWYQLCVNKLEELVVKHLFELTKMNLSQTGELESLWNL